MFLMSSLSFLIHVVLLFLWANNFAITLFNLTIILLTRRLLCKYSNSLHVPGILHLILTIPNFLTNLYSAAAKMWDEVLGAFHSQYFKVDVQVQFWHTTKINFRYWNFLLTCSLSLENTVDLCVNDTYCNF